MNSHLGFLVIGLCFLYLNASEGYAQSANIHVNVSEAGSEIPPTLFGVSIEEINHGVTGGLWAELISNRGFEAGGQNVPSYIDPWSIIGNESSVVVSTDRSSCFERNKIAVRMDVLCENEGCPPGGVGIYNPGYWGMNIENGKTYNVVFHVRSLGSVDLSVSLASTNRSQILASSNFIASSSEVLNWKKLEVQLEASGSDHSARLQFTTSKKGVIWLDQVSAMPVDTYKGHGFRKELVQMIANLKPGFIRFPGGCFVEGSWLRNAFRWKESVGPWEERPGHFNDVWHYWTDDALGYFEYLQLAEDLGSLPVWVINNGISHREQISTSAILPFVQEMLESIEFARGNAKTKWGSVRAAMGHPEPFNLKYIAIGNEDCDKEHYLGNYLKYYDALRRSYPDIKIITNCDGSSHKLDHPSDIYDIHIYESASSMFNLTHKFDHISRAGPKGFVSEYDVHGEDAGKGSFLAALAEAGFLVGIEKNSDIIEMASYAPFFMNEDDLNEKDPNENDQTWIPDAVVLNSWTQYGTPSYWVQQLFAESSGARLLNHSLLLSNVSSSLVAASTIKWKKPEDNSNCLRIKIVNFGSDALNLTMAVDGNLEDFPGYTRTLLTAQNLMDENSFNEPDKVVPVTSAGEEMDVMLPPNSVSSFDFLLGY
ncbi:hypothetical protein MKX03_003948 [Papaver bracteatum]|nr:hypothetical protein MKX03_003948 [Papaver bracteatum]